MEKILEVEVGIQVMEVVDGGGPGAGNVKMEGGPPLEAEGVDEAAAGRLINTILVAPFSWLSLNKMHKFLTVYTQFFH